MKKTDVFSTSVSDASENVYLCFYFMISFGICIYILLYKETVYNKQLALGWQIAKQLSGLNLLSLSNNRNYRLKKSGVFFCI